MHRKQEWNKKTSWKTTAITQSKNDTIWSMMEVIELVIYSMKNNTSNKNSQYAKMVTIENINIVNSCYLWLLMLYKVSMNTRVS